MMTRSAVTLTLAAVLWSATAGAQALPSFSSLRVAYNTRKATTRPDGDLKARLDAVDREMATAVRAGDMGEARRQLAKGMALLSGTPWTPALDYQNSLAIRADRTVVDSSEPWVARIEQIYKPAIELSPDITARVSLMRRQAARASAPGALPLAAAREFGRFEDVPRDLRESPYVMDLDLAGLPDGAYSLEAELFDGQTRLGVTRLAVVLQHGLEARLRALESGAASVPEALRADVRYPGDFIRNVNRGRTRLGTFDVAAKVAAAEATLAVARKGQDPFKGRTGSLERHYLLDGAGEIMPYRVYVPTGYRAAVPTPLVVALHGLGANEDSFFDGYSGTAVKLAERHGFLMVAPLGYRPDGFYGSPIGSASDAAARRRGELSEKDVLETVRLMRAQYNVDAARIYLVGHSMGAIGTWYLGAKYPDLWAALGLFSGTGSPGLVAKMKGIPQIVVHGDADATVSVSGSRAMVAEMTRLGVEVVYVEVPGGSHTDVVVPNLPKVFDFLAAHRRSSASVAK